MDSAAGGAVERERHRDLDRLLTFVDAIVAIAITLLVLPLVELAPELHEGGRAADLLRDHSDELWAVALSFYVIARIWLGQHHAVAPLVVGNARTTTLLLTWAFTIVVLPFPTSLVAASGGQATVKVLYVGTVALGVLLNAGLRAEVQRHPELTDGAAYEGPLGSLLTALLLLVALAVMLLLPATSYVPILVLAAEGRLKALVESLRNRRST
ncbi:DUF1211 domain-containing protein [Nocardioides anomalus]|uniref:DUF1211 domain-containing protein n=1 Tax=Nocardioides anomalus TaxID=2712223 RepID=A0A6G6WBI7_9ACTN|nr:TMEM175 family protein [Nocardioides anomalus]QIG42711.1 DUF1211 domain-containing protein [Nocardioides anomalus]